jgi:dUTP pyrophosphatase
MLASYYDVKFTAVHKNAKVPSLGTDGSAGYDLTAVEKYSVPKGKRIIVKTGIKLEMPTTLFAKIAARSGLSVKHSIDIAAGIIDSDYRGELGVVFVNNGESDYTINVGDKVAQLVFLPRIVVKFDVVAEQSLSTTVRGASGYGSTDDATTEKKVTT